MGKFGQMVSKIGRGVHKVGELATKIGESKTWGKIAPVVKAGVSIGGVLLDGETEGESSKIANKINQGIDFSTDGRLAKWGGRLEKVGDVMSGGNGGGGGDVVLTQPSINTPPVLNAPSYNNNMPNNSRHNSRRM
jgi:hypothetical protein